MQNIDPRPKSISQYLKIGECSFVIPEYQRAYSWEVKDCDKLFTDIKDYISAENFDDSYFFGSIIVDFSNEKELKLIDGQQRTTTFLLLINAIRLHLYKAISGTKSDEASRDLNEDLKLNLYKVNGCLFNIVGAGNAYNENPEKIKGDLKFRYSSRSINEDKELSKELDNIILGADFESIKEAVYKYEGRRQDNRYTKYFKNFRYFYDELLKYNPSELNNFANKLLENCQIIEIRSWNVEQAINMFNSLNSTGRPLSDSDIISAQLFAEASKYNREDEFIILWKNIITESNSLNEKIGVSLDDILTQYMYIIRAKRGETEATLSGLRKFFITDNKALLNDPFGFMDNVTRIIENWQNIIDHDLRKLLFKFSDNARFYLAAFLYEREPRTDELNRFILALLKLFVILEVSNYAYSTKLFKVFLFTENPKIVDKSVDVSVLVVDIETNIDNFKEESVMENIREYPKHSIVYLNEYLYDKENFKLIEPINVEHIMPESGRNIKQIRKAANVDESEFLRYRNMVGNKILLEEGINKSLGPDWFKTKKDGYKDSKFKLAAKLSGYSNDLWTKDDIDKATEKAARRMIRFVFEKTQARTTPTPEELAQIELLRSKGFI